MSPRFLNSFSKAYFAAAAFERAVSRDLYRAAAFYAARHFALPCR